MPCSPPSTPRRPSARPASRRCSQAATSPAWSSRSRRASTRWASRRHLACLAPSCVRFVGEPIAVVVADTAYAAADGCELVRVDYESLPASTIDARTRRGRPRLHADHERTCSSSAATATATSRRVRRRRGRGQGTFRHARLSASPSSPAASSRAGRAGPHGLDGTQVPHIVRAALAQLSDSPAAGARHRARYGRRVRQKMH